MPEVETRGPMRMASVRDRAGYEVDGGDREMEEVLQDAAAGQKRHPSGVPGGDGLSGAHLEITMGRDCTVRIESIRASSP